MKGIWLSLLVFGTGCSVKMIPTQDLSLERPPAVEEAPVSFLFKSLVDERGNELFHNSPLTFVPVVNLFYLSGRNRYPDLSAAMIGTDGTEQNAVVGSLAHALPYILERQVRESRLTTRTAVLEQLEISRRPSDFDYIVEGRVKASVMRTEANVLPLGALSLIGVPFVFGSGQVEVQMDIRDTTTNQIVKTHTYTWSGRRAVGIYYNINYVRSMMEEALEEITHSAVVDLEAFARQHAG